MLELAFTLLGIVYVVTIIYSGIQIFRWLMECDEDDFLTERGDEEYRTAYYALSAFAWLVTVHALLLHIPFIRNAEWTVFIIIACAAGLTVGVEMALYWLAEHVEDSDRSRSLFTHISLLFKLLAAFVAVVALPSREPHDFKKVQNIVLLNFGICAVGYGLCMLKMLFWPYFRIHLAVSTVVFTLLILAGPFPESWPEWLRVGIAGISALIGLPLFWRLLGPEFMETKTGASLAEHRRQVWGSVVLILFALAGSVVVVINQWINPFGGSIGWVMAGMPAALSLWMSAWLLPQTCASAKTVTRIVRHQKALVNGFLKTFGVSLSARDLDIDCTGRLQKVSDGVINRIVTNDLYGVAAYVFNELSRPPDALACYLTEVFLSRSLEHKLRPTVFVQHFNACFLPLLAKKPAEKEQLAIRAYVYEGKSLPGGIRIERKRDVFKPFQDLYRRSGSGVRRGADRFFSCLFLPNSQKAFDLAKGIQVLAQLVAEGKIAKAEDLRHIGQHIPPESVPDAFVAATFLLPFQIDNALLALTLAPSTDALAHDLKEFLGSIVTVDGTVTEADWRQWIRNIAGIGDYPSGFVYSLNITAWVKALDERTPGDRARAAWLRMAQGAMTPDATRLLDSVTSFDSSENLFQVSTSLPKTHPFRMDLESAVAHMRSEPACFRYRTQKVNGVSLETLIVAGWATTLESYNENTNN